MMMKHLYIQHEDTRICISNKKANIFHVNRARINYRKCRIDKIISYSGTCLSTKEDISGEIISHISKIFKNQPSPDTLAGTEFQEVRDCFKPTPNLTAPIYLLEIRAALMAMKSKKSSGTDGIPYVTFPVLPRRLRDVIQFVYDRGCHDSSKFSIRGMGAAIVGVDFEKAYDLVNREALCRILDVMGYPTIFVLWLQTIAFVDDVTIFISCDKDFTRGVTFQ
ncbi:Uncharacterized protein APZ42_025147 [Daphnia magna]|uniref:Reverse transcriptase domain-containing protein n=1 Tax=Daphnia magna TaxID=35525 RepID=A0A164TEC4_9CRUS|nr:Uncharacterized protein APZ42_025147 [Daphnia magna]